MTTDDAFAVIIDAVDNLLDRPRGVWMRLDGIARWTMFLAGSSPAIAAIVQRRLWERLPITWCVVVDLEPPNDEKPPVAREL